MLCVQMRPAATNVARLYVCLCVCKHTSWQCNSGWTDRHAVWWIYSGGPRNHVLDGGGSSFPHTKRHIRGYMCLFHNGLLYIRRPPSSMTGHTDAAMRLLSIYFGHLLCGQRPTATYVARCVVCDSVRENVCNNSKNVKIFVFLDFDKKRKKGTLRTVSETA